MLRSGPYVTETVELEISTKAASGGLIFWHGPNPSEVDPDDFFSIGVNGEGKVELQWDYGSGVAKAISNSNVTDGEKHLVKHTSNNFITIGILCFQFYFVDCTEKARQGWHYTSGFRGYSGIRC